MVVIDLRDTDLGNYSILALVCGSDKEKERQRAEIRVYWPPYALRDSQFVSDWAEVQGKLTQTEPKRRLMLIVSDLLVISKDPEDWAKRVILFIETNAVLWPAKEEHREWVNRNCADGRGMTFTVEGRPNILRFLESQYCGLLEQAQEATGEQ
jgi:hypothetical protein